MDWIIHALHGELGENEIKAERGRMSLSLKAGAEKGLWEEVPAQPGCYTKELACCSRLNRES
jgi:ferric iron reductase protein FhuF